MKRLAYLALMCAACRPTPRDAAACTETANCVANVWDALGDAQLDQSDDKAAVNWYRLAFDHREPDDLHGRTLDARGLYRSYAIPNDYKSAMHYAAIAYTASANLDDRELRGRVLIGVIVLLVNMGDFSPAEAVLREAEGVVDPATDVGLRMRQMRAAIDLVHGRPRIAVHELQEVCAQASAHKNQLLVDATLDLVNAALQAGELDLAEQTLAAFPPELRTSGERPQDYANIAARVLMARGRNDDAIVMIAAALKDPHDFTAALEGLRGRALMRSGRLAEAERSLRASIEATESLRDEAPLDALKPGVMEQLRQPFEDLFRLYVDEGRVVDALGIVQRATARSIYDGLASVHAEGVPIEQQIDRAGDRATGIVALAHSLRVSASTRPPDGQTLVASLRGRHVLTYFRANGDIWVIALRESAPPIAHRIGPVEELRAKIDAWLAAPDQVENGKDLARLLLPRDIRPRPGTTVYISADEPVRDISFAALPVDDGYLIDKNPVAYSPSASLPALSRATDAAATAIVLGDPTGDLPAARREAVDVAAAVGAKPFIGVDATRKRLVSLSRLLHVAGHTELTSRGPALLLADGPLDSGEIIDRSLAADVVVLSSCAAANPRDRDELAPLANAFLAAGSGAVVATRWAVDDEVALKFAHAFYAAGGARDPVAATGAAQRKLIAEKVAAQKWATFVVLRAPSRKGDSE